ncbi:MAG: acetylxylan esterase [Clostridia bacterium]|nr:acetylxylan esterase [Clostridia bacterium]
MSNNYFACKTDKAPHAYRCGETATLSLFFRNEGQTVSAPKFKWQIAADFGFKDEGITSGATGEFTLTATMERPGFVYVTAQAVDENGAPLPESDPFYGGVGFEIEKIHAVTEEPEGYHKFWETCKKELYCVDPEVISIVSVPKNELHPNHDIYDIRIVAPGGIPVSGILTIPKSEEKLGAKVVYQGYGVKSAWINFSDTEMILCINAHGIHNLEPQSYYDDLAKGRLAGYGFDKEQNVNPHTCYFKYMMLRAGQALRYMMTRPEWDGKTLIARGGSQGGVQAMQASWLVPEVTYIDIFVPWLCDVSMASTGRLCGWGDFSGNAIRFFDLTLRARYIDKKTQIIAGLGDYTSPPAGIVAMMHNLKGEHTLYFGQSREHIYIAPESETFKVEE